MGPLLTSAPLRFLLDLIVLTATISISVIFRKYVTPRETGAFCNDVTIQYPYTKESISDTILIVFCFVLPIIFILLKVFYSRNGNFFAKSNVNLCGFCVPQFVYDIYMHLGYYLQGLLTTFAIVSVTKCTTGVLRPHFVAVCDPSPEFFVNCSMEHPAFYQSVYCNNPDDAMVRQARLSLPSAHSAIGTYASVFFVIYWNIFKTTENKCWKPVKIIMLFAIILMNVFNCSSRVVEHHHFTVDVIAGAAIGLLGIPFAQWTRPKCVPVSKLCKDEYLALNGKDVEVVNGIVSTRVEVVEKSLDS